MDLLKRPFFEGVVIVQGGKTSHVFPTHWSPRLMFDGPGHGQLQGLQALFVQKWVETTRNECDHNMTGKRRNIHPRSL